MVNPELTTVVILTIMGVMFATLCWLCYDVGKLEITQTHLVGLMEQWMKEHKALLNTQRSLFESFKAISDLVNAPSPGQNAPAERKRPSLSVVDPLKPEDPTAA